MEDYLDINREAWNKRTTIHAESAFYDVKGFLEGKTSLREIELRELGDVRGKSLLHLQCHFGLDTLSWARLGARVAGVDLSPASIEKANALKTEAGLEASFICSDVYSYGEGRGDHSLEKFDIVFTSYGAICWLPDLDRWARVVAKKLKPGGLFYMAEFHPVYDIISGYSYFQGDEGLVEMESGYTENDQGEDLKLVTWTHPIGDVVNALTGAGIRISQLNEYPYSPYNCFEGLIEREQGRFYLPHQGHDIPLVFTIMGTKQS